MEKKLAMSLESFCCFEDWMGGLLLDTCKFHMTRMQQDILFSVRQRTIRNMVIQYNRCVF